METKVANEVMLCKSMYVDRQGKSSAMESWLGLRLDLQDIGEEEDVDRMNMYTSIRKTLSCLIKYHTPCVWATMESKNLLIKPE